jgi:L-asparaginase II
MIAARSNRPAAADLSQAANPVLAEVARSGRTESAHRGSVLVLDVDGSVAVSAGTTRQPMFPRSANKPLQATAMLDSGLGLEGRLLALAAASHSGEDYHVAGVRQILAGAGLAESDLRCPPDLPLDEGAKAVFLRSGGSADRVHMNCSGKHAAMLATCVAAGWPTATYRDPGHPLQLRIRQTVERLAAEPVTAIGVDGCGAPLMAISLAGLTRAFRALVLAETSSSERRVADAMRAHPTWTSGTGRAEAALMDAVPGLLVKSGAEGVCAFALADGRAGAVKIDDGSQRAAPPVVAALLLHLIRSGPPGQAAGAHTAEAGRLEEPDLAALELLARPPVTGGGEPVGEIRAVLPLPAEGAS